MSFADMMLTAPKNEADKRYGRLAVLDEAGRARHGAVTWHCRCDCGQRRVVAGADLRRGHTTSCGCVQREAVAESNVLKPRGRWQRNKRLLSV
jgi:hypothetical protein